MEESSVIAAVSDALSEITRKERRYLLRVSILGIAITQANLIPSTISVFGNTFDRFNQGALLTVLAFVVFYYVAAFIIYAAADLVVWRIRYNKVAIEENDKAKNNAIEYAIYPSDEGNPKEEFLSKEERDGFDKNDLVLIKEQRIAIRITRLIPFIRAVFDFVLPVIVGCYSAQALLFR